MRKVILVAGMHRSGTSALTHGLEVLGCTLGANLLGPIAGDNDKGFFEDLDLQSFNDTLLAALGRRWDTPDPITSHTPVMTQPAIDYARMLVASKAVTDAPFAFKDPRMSLLMPFWSLALADYDEVGLAIALRNPLSVAASLERRNGIPIETGLRLWMMHNLALLSQAPTSWRKVVVDYDFLVQRPRSQLVRMMDAFSLPIIGDAVEYCDQFLDADLRHAKHSPSDLATVDRGIAHTYAVMRLMAADRVPVESAEFREELNKLMEAA